MAQQYPNPYLKCPAFRSTRFIVRLVREDDALALLECYADQLAWPIFNSDGLPTKFMYRALPEMEYRIDQWMQDYEKRIYVRFGIVDRDRDKAIGTIELYPLPGAKPGYGKIGQLRLDLPSRYETENVISEILQLVESQFYGLFGVDSIITKAIPAAKARIAALEKLGYQSLSTESIVPYKDYYIIRKRSGQA